MNMYTDMWVHVKARELLHLPQVLPCGVFLCVCTCEYMNMSVCTRRPEKCIFTASQY